MPIWCHAEDSIPSQLKFVYRRHDNGGLLHRVSKIKNEHSLVLMTLIMQHGPDVIRTLPVDCLNYNMCRKWRVTGEPRLSRWLALFKKVSGGGVLCAERLPKKPYCGRVSQRHCLGSILGSNYTVLLHAVWARGFVAPGSTWGYLSVGRRA